MSREDVINTNLSLIQALLASQGAQFAHDHDSDGRPYLSGMSYAVITLEAPDKAGGIEPSTLVRGIADKLKALGLSAYPDGENDYRLIIEGEGLATPALSQFLLSELGKNAGLKESVAASRLPAEGRG